MSSGTAGFSPAGKKIKHKHLGKNRSTTIQPKRKKKAFQLLFDFWPRAKSKMLVQCPDSPSFAKLRHTWTYEYNWCIFCLNPKPRPHQSESKPKSNPPNPNGKAIWRRGGGNPDDASIRGEFQTFLVHRISWNKNIITIQNRIQESGIILSHSKP